MEKPARLLQPTLRRGYSSSIVPWISKALTEPVNELIMLVPARTGNRWFQALFHQPITICFIAGRLTFSAAPHPATFDSALLYRGSREHEFTEAFKHRGYII